MAELREVVTTSTFGLVLAGGLQIQLDTTKAGLGPENKLPALLPLAHLGPRQTFGELADAGSRMAFLNGGVFPEQHRPVALQKLGISPIGFVLGLIINRARFGRSCDCTLR